MSVPPADNLSKKIERLVDQGQTLLLVGSEAGTQYDRPGIYRFPADTPDPTLASLIALFLAFRDKEAHFDWITDELTQVNQSLVEETKRLKATRDELDLKNKKMTEELALANIIQNSLLPKEFPRDVPLNFSHKYIPHEYIGGDFFEILQVDERHLGILIADVSGHGVSSALITAMLKSTFIHAARDCLSPGRVLRKVNVDFTRVMRTEHYITAFYTVIDTESYKLTYAAAGHPRQLILRKGAPAEPIGANGFFLGMFESTVYDEKSITLDPGDRLIFFTDGLIECPNSEGRHFGAENLKRVIETHRDEDIESLSKNLIVELIAYMADARFPDDVTLLIGEIIPLL
ncbi:MAG: serine/threonine-protein phosphatase [Spirochaetales bacterium]|nr:serine/threonine-protein phosphatase [Spirochaetales bacterium]